MKFYEVLLVGVPLLIIFMGIPFSIIFWRIGRNSKAVDDAARNQRQQKVVQLRPKR